MEHYKAEASDSTRTNPNNNNNSHSHHHNHRHKKETVKQQPLRSMPSSKKRHIKSISMINPTAYQESNTVVSNPRHQQKSFMKDSISWKKRWSLWFSSCSSERTAYVKCNPITISIEKTDRTKSENDLSKRGSIDQDEKKHLSTTTSTLVISPISNENQEKFSSKISTHQHRHHHQSIDKVNNSNSVIYCDTSNRHSNTFFPSTRYEQGGQHRSETLIAVIPSATDTSQQTHHKQQARQLSRSADRLNSKSSRRELRYEEHNDYISSPPSSSQLQPPPLLNSIQCHPTIDHYARSLNQSSYFYSTHRRSQIEVYQLPTEKNRVVLPRPYSSNFPFTHNTILTNIPITYSHTVDNIPIMSQTPPDNTATYEKLFECHSPLVPVENSSVKPPRRIESPYSQFPTTQQEPVYANTQSLYDNIIYPEGSSSSKISNRNEKKCQEKKSCASQTQLTWTMATFSSFVDLENQSIVIQQPDPATLYSIVQHHHTEPPPSASAATIDHMKVSSSSLQYIDDTSSPSHFRPERTPTPSKSLMIEKRDGSFQTLLTIAPMQGADSSKQIVLHDTTPSPLSTHSSSTNDQHHHHHHHHHHNRHRRNKSQSNTSRNNINTRDVGLQVNIQTVKKITFLSQKSDDSSLTTSAPSPPTVIPVRELKHVQTNTEPSTEKHDKSTSYEKSTRMVSSASQTLDSSTIVAQSQGQAAQTLTKSLRDQSIETNNRGLFVCDLSSFLKNGIDEISSTKQKS
ncbi:unnamed protein product [Rotaria socialis]|uniref:Uncharacterized protein n=1 Tax=Rotaria socialis TaxID=392032 RepID=A0A818GAX1_9BILA|nr:unnamed protein product [Rotaria socialis]CAF4284328.1 unnamed protein product [Rotaria socialis]